MNLTFFFIGICFFQKFWNIYYNSIANNSFAVFVHNSTGQKMKIKFFLSNYNCMTSIVSTLIGIYKHNVKCVTTECILHGACIYRSFIKLLGDMFSDLKKQDYTMKQTQKYRRNILSDLNSAYNISICSQ